MARRSGFVTRTGQKLYLDGSLYTFTGLNIYYANSRWNCGAAFGYNDGELAAALTTSGVRSFRAWFFQSLATIGGARDWAAFDHTLAVARAAKVKVIVTLTNQWGDCENTAADSPVYKDADWYRTGYRTALAPIQTYRDWVTAIVTRYRADPTILAWQLINEAEVKVSATGGCTTDAAVVLKTWATDMARLVKSIDSRHLLSLGTIGGGQCGASYLDYQIVHDIPEIDLCEYHDYGADSTPVPGDQWNGLAMRLGQSAALNKPLFVGEAGIVTSDPNRAAKFSSKITAQFAAGIVGFLPWVWNTDTNDPYAIGPGDPTLALL